CASIRPGPGRLRSRPAGAEYAPPSAKSRTPSLRSRSLGTRPPGATTGPHSCPTTGHQVRTDQNPHGQAHSPDLMKHRGYHVEIDIPQVVSAYEDDQVRVAK